MVGYVLKFFVPSMVKIVSYNKEKQVNNLKLIIIKKYKCSPIGYFI